MGGDVEPPLPPPPPLCPELFIENMLLEATEFGCCGGKKAPLLPEPERDEPLLNDGKALKPPFPLDEDGRPLLPLLPLPPL